MAAKTALKAACRSTSPTHSAQRPRLRVALAPPALGRACPRPSPRTCRRRVTLAPAAASVELAPLLAPLAPAAAAAAATGVEPAASTATAAAAAAAVLLRIDPHVLGATLGASFKLSLVCALVGWLLASKQIPGNTATVLSKVSYTLLIPAMLFTKVAATLAAQPDPAILATISAFTLLQIVAGAGLGQLVGAAVDRFLAARRRRHAEVHGVVAAAAGAGMGVGAATGVALESDGEAPTGLRQLVTLACSFGSSFTLPVVFFSTMLPAVAAERALGYTALIMLSWSPCLWSLGLSIVHGKGGSSSGGDGGHAAGQAAAGAAAARVWRRCAGFARKVVTPPFLAILAGMLAGLTPAGRALLVGGAGGSGARAAAVAAAGKLPLGLGLASGVLRSAMDVVKMLAGGTLAAQTVVLAASLLQQPEDAAAPSAPAAATTHSGGGSAAVVAAAAAVTSPAHAARSAAGGGIAASARRLLLPEDAAEARALAIVSLTRFLLLPALTLGGVWALRRGGLLPPAVAADPVLLLVLLAEAVMPSAQNLIILLQLSERTQALAPTLAHMLLKLYAYSVLPVTLWVTGWATWLGVEVVC